MAVDNEKLALNPASRIRRKAENNQTVRFLTKEEEGRIRSVLVTRCSACLPAFIVSLHTGLRASEQWNLRWSDIDLERRTLAVRRQKSGKGERHIRLNQTAVAAFESLRVGDGLAGVPFLNSKGTPMTSHREWFDPAVAEAKVSEYTWHKNRHTFASRLQWQEWTFGPSFDSGARYNSDVDAVRPFEPGPQSISRRQAR